MIELNRPTWSNDKHVYPWEMSFSKYVNPVLGSRLIGEVTTADVLQVLTPIWTGKHETANRVWQRLGAVMDWAFANGYRSDNPAGAALAKVLPKMPKTKEHLTALPYAEVPGALKKVEASGADLSTKLSLAFLVLTAARSSEVRLATWSEVDWVSETWTIPADRMKARREHRVPLSSRSIQVLQDARALDVDAELIFPSPLTGRPLSDMTHPNMLRKLKIQAVPYGFRSSFRDWASEQTDAPHAVMEAALAHAVQNATEAAYARSDLVERRRVLMNQWAEYLENADTP